MRFDGRRVFITGASRGIGRATAEAFKAEGAFVIGTLTGRAAEGGDFCDEWVKADFLSVEDIKSCAQRVRDVAPDVLVNNAGINRVAPFVEVTAEDFLAIHQVNVFAPFLLCQAAVPSMREQRRGRIVNVSSVWGKISKEHRASYSASKFALDGLTVALAAEHSADGILANSIAPGFVDTELTRRVLGAAGIERIVSGVPSRRLGHVDEIARLILWLSSDENTYLSGQNIAIDGGFTRV